MKLSIIIATLEALAVVSEGVALPDFDPCARMGPIGALTMTSAYFEAARYSECAGLPPPNPAYYGLFH